MDKSQSLRKKYPNFIFENCQYYKENNSLVIIFSFKIPPDIKFSPKIEIQNIDSNLLEQIERPIIDNFIFNLGLVEMIGYWKVTCSPNLLVKAGFLNQNQIDWWKNLIKKGLGEFFYQNKIDFKKEELVSINCDVKKELEKDNIKHKERYLVLNGGGRDSVVSIETLKELKKESSILMLNPTLASLQVAEVSAIQSKIKVIREIDKKLLELNDQGFLNGHTPFSAYLAFLSVLCALLFDYKFVIASNERSANEENIQFVGEKINHQYSKTFEFENSFRQYLAENLSQNIEYFSLLRPLYEIQISKIFSTYPQYFNAFKSCNRGQKDNTWCCKCPKCLSIYITLYPFVETQQLIKVFGEDLFARENLSDLLLHLIGEKTPKPFECVGTGEELQEGLRLSVKKLEESKKSLPFLLNFAKEKFEKITERNVMNAWDKNNNLAQDIAESLKGKLND